MAIIKYKDTVTGDYIPVNTKTLDTLPVGTEVDFDGTNIPDGWEQIDNVLWTNSNLTSSFTPQTVTLSDDIENYEYYEVLFKFSTSSSSTLSISTGKIKTGMVTVLSLPVGTNYSRTITSMSGKDFKFGPGGSYATYGTTTLTVDNTYLIPYKIIGYKGRIKKVAQYIEGGASLSNVYGTSNENGYTQSYVNGIIESGGTANNYYIKYADGTMICTQKYTANVNYSTVFVGMYRCTAIITVPNFAQTFVDVPTISVKSNVLGVATCVESTTSNVGKLFGSKEGQGYQETIFDIIAVGRWKAQQ